jgi:hypothetical protein
MHIGFCPHLEETEVSSCRPPVPRNSDGSITKAERSGYPKHDGFVETRVTFLSVSTTVNGNLIGEENSHVIVLCVVSEYEISVRELVAFS